VLLPLNVPLNRPCDEEANPAAQVKLGPSGHLDCCVTCPLGCLKPPMRQRQTEMAVQQPRRLYSDSLFCRGQTVVLLPPKVPLTRLGGGEAFSAASRQSAGTDNACWSSGGCPTSSPKGRPHRPPQGAMVMTFVLFSGEQLIRTP
jgi:hypothetical protein